MVEYIEREAAVAYAPLPKHLREYQTMNLDDAWEDGYDFAIGQIEAIPAADVAPVRHGRWTGHDIGNGRLSIDEDTCSLCGSRFYQIAETGCVWHYCPNCGAQMKDGDGE